MIEPTVLIFANVVSQQGIVFTLNDPIKGTLDNGGTYPLAIDQEVDVTDESQTISIVRGRQREFDQMMPGTCTVSWPNDLRQFDDLYSGSQFYGVELTGKKMQVLIGGVSIFSGWIDDISFSYSPTGVSGVSIRAIDSLGQLARREFDEWTATPGKAGARIAEVLDRSDVRFGSNRDLDTGVSDLQGDTVSWGANVLNYLELVALSDLGRVFASRSDVLTFRDRSAVLNEPSAAVFTGNDDGILYAAIRRRNPLELTYNRVSVDIVGGTKQTAINEASVDLRGLRSLTMSGLLLDSDTSALGLAEHLVSLYGVPVPRISSLTVDLDAIVDASIGVLTALDISSIVQALFTPDNVGAEIDQQLIVEGMTWNLSTARVNTVALSFSTADERQFFTLDDSVLGVLDAGMVLAF